MGTLDYSKFSILELEELILSDNPEEALSAYLSKIGGLLMWIGTQVFGFHRDETEDRMAEVLFEFSKRRHMLKPGYLKRWFAKAMFSRCLNYVAVKKRRVGREETFDEAILDLSGSRDLNTETFDLGMALMRLDAKDQRIIYNLFVEGHTAEEVAKIEGCSRRWIEEKKASILTMLRGRMLS